MIDKNSGSLYLIPVNLGENEPSKIFPTYNIKVVERLNHFIVENEKSARRFIKQILPDKPQQELKLNSLNKFTDPLEIPSFLDPIKDGMDIGLLSEAGCPGVADPGAEIVKLAHQNNIKVIPLVGPSSILLAMMASGMNGQSFSFNGYLPIDKKERKQQIKFLERISSEQNQAQLFIETPYRNNKFLEDLIENLHPSTQLCVACDLTLTSEFIKTAPVEAWKKIKTDLHKRPAIFIFQKDV
ncbi:SAM-dependent methyltransferase [Gramella sp. AN32]|uniref:SAM-dependent methyltransferase n=1 Tax=Christiangramia antarctica TaxID=2058158 RepID=A0ABW5X659_9FLAO|nr:SAM-dependent methyltransferase [Gramella sp. AN32]